MHKGRIIVVDDEEDMLETCSDILESAGYQVKTASSGSSALELIRNNSFDLAIIDLIMPGIKGMNVFKMAKKLKPDLMVIIFTGYPEVETAVEAIKEGAFDYIPKPFSPDQLSIAVDKAMAHLTLIQENRFLRSQLRESYRFEDIIGKSEALNQVLDMVRRISDSDSNVLVLGESGTGKELIVKSIHMNSPRRDRYLVPVNCGNLPDNLLESELFGYEKGAFTGADATKPGLLEFADGGTFLLDEVCDLSLSLQVKLLRFLQDGTFRRVGGKDIIKVDVRIVSVTNRDIEAAVTENAFREDLYYRLNVIKIVVPPLRERTEDIPLLSTYFMEKYSEGSNKRVVGITSEAMHYLTRYQWPGNIRELENAVERAVLMANGEYITPDDLPEPLVKGEGGGASGGDIPFRDAKQRVMEEFERNYLAELLGRFGGNVTMAAGHAGMNRSALQRMMKRYGMRSADFRRE